MGGKETCEINSGISLASICVLKVPIGQEVLESLAKSELPCRWSYRESELFQSLCKWNEVKTVPPWIVLTAGAVWPRLWRRSSIQPLGRGGAGVGRFLLNQSFHHEIHNVLPSDSVGSKRGRKSLKKLTEVSEYIIVTGNICMSKRKNEWMRTWRNAR